jgi:hypothetical protein
MLRFEEEGHRYFWNDTELPAYSTVMGEWILVGNTYKNVFTEEEVPKENFEKGQQMGKAIHKACYLILQEALDWKHLEKTKHPALPAAKEFQRFIHEHRVKAVFAEQAMCSLKYGYGITPDVVGNIIDSQWLSVVEIKTFKHSTMVGVQTSAQVKAIKEYNQFKKHVDRFLLTLPKDGSKYSFEKLNGLEEFKFFLLRLGQHNFLKGVKK